MKQEVTSIAPLKCKTQKNHTKQLQNPFSWNSIYSNRQFYTAFSIFLTYCFFSSLINGTLTDFILANKLNIAASYNIWLLFPIAIIVFVFIYFNFQQFSISPAISWLVLFFSSYLFYLYIIGFNHWTVVNKREFAFLFLPAIAILFYRYLQFYESCLEKKKNEKEETSPIISFLEDRSIQKIKDDKYFIESYVKQVAEKIKNTNTENSFCISVNSEWGTGKTSFLNFIKEQLENDVIILEYNAWLAETPEMITKDFLELLAEKLAPNYIGIEGTLKKYSNELIGRESNIILRVANKFVSLFSTDDKLSANSQFESLREKIKKIDKKIVVLLDDTDRLEKGEVLAVLRMIRNTANFPNTFFVLGYDRLYIEDALKKSEIYNYDKYLEKIIQFEVSLPSYKPEVLYQKIKQDFVNKPNNIYRVSENVFEVIKEDFSYWFSNERDYLLFRNSFYTNIAVLGNTINNDIFFLLELIKLKHPSTYREIYKKQDSFLINHIIEKPIKPFSLENNDKVQGKNEEQKQANPLLSIDTNQQINILVNIIKKKYSEAEEYSFYKYFNYYNSNIEIEFSKYFTNTNINEITLYNFLSIFQSKIQSNDISILRYFITNSSLFFHNFSNWIEFECYCLTTELQKSERTNANNIFYFANKTIDKILSKYQGNFMEKFVPILKATISKQQVDVKYIEIGYLYLYHSIQRSIPKNSNWSLVFFSDYLTVFNNALSTIVDLKYLSPKYYFIKTARDSIQETITYAPTLEIESEISKLMSINDRLYLTVLNKMLNETEVVKEIFENTSRYIRNKNYVIDINLDYSLVFEYISDIINNQEQIDAFFNWISRSLYGDASIDFIAKFLFLSPQQNKSIINNFKLKRFDLLSNTMLTVLSKLFRNNTLSLYSPQFIFIYDRCFSKINEYENRVWSKPDFEFNNYKFHNELFHHIVVQFNILYKTNKFYKDIFNKLVIYNAKSNSLQISCKFNWYFYQDFLSIGKLINDADIYNEDFCNNILNWLNPNDMLDNNWENTAEEFKNFFNFYCENRNKDEYRQLGFVPYDKFLHIQPTPSN